MWISLFSNPPQLPVLNGKLFVTQTFLQTDLYCFLFIRRIVRSLFIPFFEIEIFLFLFSFFHIFLLFCCSFRFYD